MTFVNSNNIIILLGGDSLKRKKNLDYLLIFENLSTINLFLMLIFIFLRLFIYKHSRLFITITIIFSLIMTIFFYFLVIYLKIKKVNSFKKMFGKEFFKLIKSCYDTDKTFKEKIYNADNNDLFIDLIVILFEDIKLKYNFNFNKNLEGINASDSFRYLINSFSNEKNYGGYYRCFIICDKNPNKLTITKYLIEFIITISNLTSKCLTDDNNKSQYSKIINECVLDFFKFFKSEESKFNEYLKKIELQEKNKSLDNQLIDRAKSLSLVLNELEEI